jgi:uncharacterized membrane protein YuzA (DUF378 family)
MVTFILIAVGALNWGLIGVANINLVNMLLGTMPTLERLVYILVGAAAVAELVTHPKCCSMCKFGK